MIKPQAVNHKFQTQKPKTKQKKSIVNTLTFCRIRPYSASISLVAIIIQILNEYICISNSSHTYIYIF